MPNHLSLYTPIHKGLRARLFKLSMRAGTLDYTDKAALEALYEEVVAVGTQMLIHHDWEEHAIHPLLADEVPGGAEQLEDAHRVAHHRFDNLKAHIAKIRVQATVEKQRALGLEFYLALNRFIVFFLEHLNEEEEHIQPVLWDLSTTKELIAAAQTPFNEPPEQVKANLVMVIAAANMDEITTLFTSLKENVPRTAFQNALDLAERILSARDWETLKSLVGTDSRKGRHSPIGRMG